jgi:hypothetical protein
MFVREVPIPDLHRHEVVKGQKRIWQGTLSPPSKVKCRIAKPTGSRPSVWAGIHYRSDIDAGQALGRAVSEQVMARVLGSAN